MVASSAAGAHWRKSSYSAGDGGECVEVARVPMAVFVRDSKLPGGGHLCVAATAWRDFLGARAAVTE